MMKESLTYLLDIRCLQLYDLMNQFISYAFFIFQLINIIITRYKSVVGRKGLNIVALVLMEIIGFIFLVKILGYMKGRQRSKMEKVPQIPPEAIPQNRQDKIHYFLQKVQDKMVQLIDTSSVKIPSKKIPFTEIKKDEAATLVNKLKMMQISKQLMQSKLQAIAQQQQDLKHKHKQIQKMAILQSRVNTRERELSPLSFRPKSELSTEDISLLKKLKKEHKQFERSLQEKTKTHEEMMQKMKKEEQDLLENRRREEGDTRKKEITKRLESLAKQQVQRQKQFQQQRRKLIEVKTKRKLFQQFQKNQKNKQKAQLQKKVALMQSRLRQKQLDLQSIKQHQQKYRQIKQQQKLTRQKRKQQFEQIVRQRKEDVSFEKSKYYTIVVEQGKRKKQEQLQKQREKADLLQAAKAYAEQVKRQYSPRIKTKSSSESAEEKKQEGLSFQEIKEVGNKYMNSAKKLLKRVEVTSKSQLSKQSKESTLNLKPNLNQSKETTKYRDYLSERRMFRTRQDKMNQTEQKIKDKFIRRDLQDIYKIMNSKEDKSQKLDRVKTIAHKLQVRNKGDDRQMIDKISAKLKILQTLTQDN